MQTRRYIALRAKLREMEMTHEEFAVELGKSSSYVALRMTGKKPWTLEDAYKTIGMFGLDRRDLHFYFPKDGITQESDYPAPSEASQPAVDSIAQAIIESLSNGLSAVRVG